MRKNQFHPKNIIRRELYNDTINNAKLRKIIQWPIYEALPVFYWIVYWEHYEKAN